MLPAMFLKHLDGQNCLAMVAHTCREIKLLAKVLVTVFICTLISYDAFSQFAVVVTVPSGVHSTETLDPFCIGYGYERDAPAEHTTAHGL